MSVREKVSISIHNSAKCEPADEDLRRQVFHEYTESLSFDQYGISSPMPHRKSPGTGPPSAQLIDPAAYEKSRSIHRTVFRACPRKSVYAPERYFRTAKMGAAGGVPGRRIFKPPASVIRQPVPWKAKSIFRVNIPVTGRHTRRRVSSSFQ